MPPRNTPATPDPNAALAALGITVTPRQGGKTKVPLPTAVLDGIVGWIKTAPTAGDAAQANFRIVLPDGDTETGGRGRNVRNAIHAYVVKGSGLTKTEVSVGHTVVTEGDTVYAAVRVTRNPAAPVSQ